MGKVKFRSSIRALHQALCNLRPVSPKPGTWVCVQQAKTHSFRDVYNSFNYIYSTASDLCILNEEPEENRLVDIDLTSKSTRFSTDLCSSAESSDSSAEIVLSGLTTGLSSQRFFFSPCTTKSITKEANPPEKDIVDVCSTPERKKLDLDFHERQVSENFEFGAGEILLGMGTGETENIPHEIGFYKESVKMAMNSDNPHFDFRVSMEEMVEAHDLREWSCLQELLHCYLKLNEKRTHKFIVGAFVEMIINLIGKAKNREAFPPLLLQE